MGFREMHGDSTARQAASWPKMLTRCVSGERQPAAAYGRAVSADRSQVGASTSASLTTRFVDRRRRSPTPSVGKSHDWYRNVFHTRGEPASGIIVVATRWHEEDLPGWLLKQEEEADEKWHILNFDAIYEEERPEFPESCTVEPDWRKPGEALCPERFPLEVLEAKRRTMGTRNFAALYQQQPSPPDGMFFKGSWFEYVDQSPDRGRRIRFWDTAGTQDAGDFTVGCLMSKHHGTFFVEDVVRGQWSPGRRDGMILATAEADRLRYGRCGGVQIWLQGRSGRGGIGSHSGHYPSPRRAQCPLRAAYGLEGGSCRPVRGSM